MKTYLIPRQFRIIGLLVIIVTLLLVFLLKSQHIINPDHLQHFLYLPILIGLVLILSAREKEEDEMILQVRLRSFQIGLYAAVFAYIFSVLINYVRDKEFILTGVESLILAVLYVLIYFKYQLFKIKSEKPD